ncbi:tetratricopeptide repeat protein [Pontibacter sp. G13]|uniref:tetratricopeptide repeat protein n=1 Tax=Pontibacter sp. G13 TaxID=3074898 RepID=UPI0028899838|nr:tetratricopeptide repeat protein [Pontibacter sp. G13]WNJ15978.1 tetratricopeptide repeat protein [Pontibacter sp. G13]
MRTRFFYVLVALLMVGTIVFRCSQRATTWSSLDPENAYTGIESCQSCHQRIYDSFLQTGMGKSLYRPDPHQQIEDFRPDVAVHDTSRNFWYQPLWKGDSMYIREFRLSEMDTVYVREERIDYVVGSGHQTRSYLIEREGFLYEAPITWYVQAGIWDMSPGYAEHNSRFDREVGQDCMGCHTGHIDYVEGSKNRYRYISAGIDCEKCHGPGEDHIRRIEAGQLIDVGEETDFSIVNPAKLPVEEQFSVCQQCHLQGTNVWKSNATSILDFRPAMKLEEVVDVFLVDDGQTEDFGIASHAERLQASQCFIQSQGKLTCTTCHDPHRALESGDTQVYIRQCQQCHQSDKHLTCGVNPEQMESAKGNCVSCHMPSSGTSDIPHVRFHDHKIRVVSQDTVKVDEVIEYFRLFPAQSGNVSPSIQGRAWLSWYEEQSSSPQWLDSALSSLRPSDGFAYARAQYYAGKYQEALTVLNASPSEPASQFLKGEVLESMGKFAEAEQVFRGIFEENPNRLEAGYRALTAQLKAQAGNPQILDSVQAQIQQLLAIKPFDVRFLGTSGFLYLNQGNLRSAERMLVQALRLDPDNLQALENMIYTQAMKGNEIQVEEYLNQLRNLGPDQALIDRVEQQLTVWK